MTAQIEKAKCFRSLHKPSNPLFLYNIWDAGSALAVERAGSKAVATSSWSVAAAQGYADGQELPFEEMLAVVTRIAKSVQLPVTVDFEGGYAVDPETVGQNVRRLLELGIVGFNFEDQIVDGPGLYGVEDQAARIRAARHSADSTGVPAFINARTDVFLKADQEAAHADLVEEALVREKAYAAAGADGFFVPGLTYDALIRRVCDAATMPVNVMTTSGQDVHRLTELGVARISLGPAPYIALISAVEKEANAFL
ncbi:isocitrate lyase/PEP mutase family protein [Agrobacterium pusense]|uniref:isocitrate lyase/PEP mutase family protein n=1 Tax=Agrobacterium pusense TaxID=648995 RepID=UPI002446F1CC|nr:isocitrate lyase/phosphoenolpyruvate mutase family protein [Agrobacterium pusense]MDH0873989.1 isocitrate lyase/phosphoenolpyruvate mutase family protein [Agrobacterium pusense]MDH1271454.1 isocitrate lyase/phosphoenolpyruvate mutase family protein [Agrobacterium pusense]